MNGAIDNATGASACKFIILALLGMALVAIPMSHADGTRATAREYAIKIGIGLAFTLLGGGLLVRAWRQLK